ncbi:MAG: HAD-IIIA family hydrolase [Candidatus Wallbacteria bacterium]
MSIFSHIKLIAMDVDGVLTNGEIIMSTNGEEIKAFSVHDGVGIKLAHAAGIATAIITGRSSSIVAKRAQELGVGDVFQGVTNKETIFEELLAKYNLKEYNVAYIGDDINDLGILKRAGVKIATLNAVTEVKDIADFTTEFEGGRGAVRDAINTILSKKGILKETIQKYCTSR